MQSRDLNEFKAVMREAREAIGQGEPYTDGGLELMFAALMDLDLRQIQAALVAHINGPDGKWRPNVHYIREQMLRAGPAWISADEAWSMIPKPGPVGSRAREDGSVVPDYRAAEWPPCLLNQATERALALAAPLLERGEESAARMAFRACYERIVVEEKAAHRPPKYYLGPGGSHDDRQTLLGQGQAAGLLPAPPRASQLVHSKPPPGALEALRTFGVKVMPLPRPEDYGDQP